jgi:hypothetical protein
MQNYMNLLTSRRILTAHLHVLEGITQSKQWVVIGSATNATKEAVVTRTILVWHLLRRKLQPMHRMQFRLFPVSYLNWRILANLAKVVVDRGLTILVPLVQQEEEVATVCDSCNPGTFLYLSQCLNSCTTVLLAIGKTIQDISYTRIWEGRPWSSYASISFVSDR